MSVIFSNFTPLNGSGHDTSFFLVKNSGFNGQYSTATEIAVAFTVPAGIDFRLDKIEVFSRQSAGSGSYLHAYVVTNPTFTGIDYNSSSALSPTASMVVFNALNYGSFKLKAFTQYYLKLIVDTGSGLSSAELYKNNAGMAGVVLFNDPSTGNSSYSPLPSTQYPAFRISGTEVSAPGGCGGIGLVQSNFGVKGNFELVSPNPGGGLAHYWRDNDNYVTSFPWSLPTLFGSGAIEAATVIQSTFGNLEVVARIGGQLAHYYRDPSLTWHGPIFFGSGVTGTPSFIQDSAGSPGNFDVVVPLTTGGLAHYRRDNSITGFPWINVGSFATSEGVVAAASLIQSSFGNLEVVARIEDKLAHYYRDALWHGPAFFATSVSGVPSLIQSYGSGNFEVVSPLAEGGMAHFWRDNSSSTSYPWFGPIKFGSGNVRSVALIQSNFGGNLEVVARIDCNLKHFYRDASAPSNVWGTGIAWHGTVTIV